MGANFLVEVLLDAPIEKEVPQDTSSFHQKRNNDTSTTNLYKGCKA